MHQVLGKYIFKINEAAQQRSAEADEAETEKLKQQGFHVMQWRQEADETARVMLPDRPILVGEQTGLKCAQRNQAVSDYRYHDMSLKGVVCHFDQMIREMQAGGYSRDAANRKNHDTETFDATIYAAQ